MVSRNVEEIDEVSGHQGEGNGNNTTRKQNVEKSEEQNEDTIEEQNVETSCNTNANDETMRDISGRRIQWFFDKKSPQFEDKRGRHVKRKISDEPKDRIRNHINSFPRIDSHYCRSSVKRQYLDPCLSIAKMYELYVLTCNTADAIPEKYHTYKNIFNLEFNLGFHTPKKDRCDHCEEYKSNKLINQVSEDLKMKYELHIAGKSNSKVERDNDRSSDKSVLCFDMENAASRTFKYNSVPFTKIKYIKLEVEKPLQVLYKVSFSDESFKEVSIVAQNTRKKQKTVVMPKVNMLTKSNLLSKEKVKDLKDMLKYMPLDDRKYYETVFKNYKPSYFVDATPCTPFPDDPDDCPRGFSKIDENKCPICTFDGMI
ncbi:unnamed protein product [Mytilus coruscus]|uniref:Uncharacterized protein n=1 Tax=Mytilus coruscus TaxID=42192 RepID=A0A6J8B707_MYTCO|nr:unnamed protein product [Mytilus coruscus]